jgi:cytochrome P450
MTPPSPGCPFSQLAAAVIDPPKVSRRVAPGPRGMPGIGCLPELRRDVLGLMLRGMRDYGDVVRYKLGPLTVHLICHPNDIAHVFAHSEWYDKNTFASAKIRQVTGDGLLVTNGEQWAAQRAAVQPAFAASRVDAYIGLIVQQTQRMLNAWEGFARRGEPIDVASEMMRLTYRVVERALFSTTTQDAMGEMETAISVAMESAYRRIQNPLSVPAFVPTAANRRFRKAMQTLERRVDQIIAEHREGKPQGDFLSNLMHGASQDGCPLMDDRALRSQTITLLLAGHETTANALTWMWWMLDQHPDAADRLCTEADCILGQHEITRDRVNALHYTSMAFSETLRLHTPIWAIVRRVIADDTIGGYHIPRGTRLVISPYVTHRHPDFWPNAERFDPQRFEPEKLRSMNRCAYLPFGGGPRYCVGKNLARLEGLIVAALVARRFRLRLLPGQTVAHDPGITLRCRGGLLMTLEAREPGT